MAVDWSDVPTPRNRRAENAWRILLALVLSTLLSFALGCQRDRTPPLIEVAELSPRDVDQGDRIEIRGAGFPQGRVAHVTFRGSIHRPGETPVARARVDVEGVVISSERIEFSASEAVEEQFCGRGGSASHGTFRGDVEVAFASSAPGAPPLVGTLHDVTFDMRPSSIHAETMEARSAEGRRVLAFMGVTHGAVSARGVPVVEVAPRSVAARAGLVAGDVIAEMDGVRIGELSDVIPSSARATELGVRHADGGALETKSVPMVGYAAGRIPVEFAPAVFLVAMALVLLSLLVLPTPSKVGAWERRLADRARTLRWTELRAQIFRRGPRLVFSLLATVLVGTFALGPHVVAPELDAALLLLLGLGFMALARITAARGPLEAMAGVGKVLAAGAVMAACVLAIVVQEGALSLWELVHDQGAMPWEASALRKPASLLFAAVFLGTLFLRDKPRVQPSLLAMTESSARARSDAEPTTGALLERLGRLFTCALAVAVFFGGWRLPFGAGSRSWGIALLGALLFASKSWLLELALTAAARFSVPWTFAEARRFALLRLLPAFVLGTTLLLITRHVAVGPSLGLTWSAATTLALVLFTGRSLARVRAAMQRPTPHASPFL